MQFLTGNIDTEVEEMKKVENSKIKLISVVINPQTTAYEARILTKPNNVTPAWTSFKKSTTQCEVFSLANKLERQMCVPGSRLRNSKYYKSHLDIGKVFLSQKVRKTKIFFLWGEAVLKITKNSYNLAVWTMMSKDQLDNPLSCYC